MTGRPRDYRRVTTFVLEIAQGSEPIEGVLSAPDGTSRRFTGTLGLLAAIEALREPATGPQEAPHRKDFGAST